MAVEVRSRHPQVSPTVVLARGANKKTLRSGRFQGAFPHT
jgi:hypothetical protein